MSESLEKLDALMLEQHLVIQNNDVLLKFMLALAPKFRTDAYEANIDFLVEDAKKLAEEYLANARLEMACINAEIKEELKEAH